MFVIFDTVYRCPDFHVLIITSSSLHRSKRLMKKRRRRRNFISWRLLSGSPIKSAVMAYKMSTWSGAKYLRDELRWPADTEARRRLRSASSTSLDVRRTHLSTVGDRAFPVAAARLWNSLPSHVTAAPSLSIFCCCLKSHLFSLSYPAFWLFPAHWLVILDTIILSLLHLTFNMLGCTL